MEIEIYADVVFLINWLMDLFILWVVKKMTRRSARLYRLIIGSAVMAILYCVFIFIAEFRMYYNLFLSLLMIMLGVKIAFQPEGVKAFFKLILISYASAFTIGGMGTALFYFTDLSHVFGSMAGFSVNHFSVIVLPASIIGFYLLMKLGLYGLERSTVKKQSFLPIRITYAESKVCLNTLVDTGNTLHDPVSRSPVIVAEFNSVKAFLPDSVRLIFYENMENSLQDILERVSGTGFSGRIRMIPFASLGRQNGMLIGFRPDKVEILVEKEAITLDDVIIGIYNFKLSQDGAYQGLLNPELLQSIQQGV